MKARHPPKRRHVSPPRRRSWLIVLVIVGLSVAVGLWLNQRNAPALPQIPLGQLNPAAAALLQERLDAVRAAPKSGPAWGALGATLRVFEFTADAEHCLVVATRLDPKEPRWPYLHGISLALRSPVKAIPLVRRAVSLCGNNPEAPRLRLAALLAENGRDDEARRELETLLRELPNHAPALLKLAYLDNARGDTAAALASTDRCLQDPRTARAAWSLRASLHQRGGDSAAARAAAERAATLPPDVLVHDPFESEARQSRSDPRSLSDRAQGFLLNRQLSNAAPLVEQLMREHPDFAETWLVAGRLQLIQRRLDEAEASLRRHIVLETNSANGHFQLGMVLLEQNRLEESAAHFARAVQIKPDLGPGYFNLGVALGRQGHKPEAVTSFREAIRHNPERIDSYILLADLLFDLGARAQAQEIARQAEALNPADRRLVQLRNKIGRE